MALNRNMIDDDINSLCSHLGLDPQTYHHFSNDAAPLGTATPNHKTDNPAANEAVLPVEPSLPLTESSTLETSTTRVETPVAAVPGEFSSSKTAVSPNALAPPVENVRSKLHVLSPLRVNLSGPPTTGLSASPIHATARWPSLRSLGGSVAKNSGINTSPVAFHAVGGGVGLTTVLATTAKALSIMGQRVLVAEDAPRSTLPLFFGARDLLNGTHSLIVSNGVPTYLLLRDSTPGTDSSDEWLWSKAAQLDTSTDVLLMEAGPQMAPRTQTWVYSAGVSIFVLEPDMRSAMALPQTLELFAAGKSRYAEPVATYFLLNKYDAESPFNVDMLRWLRDELDGMLAPVVLRRDYRVSEALAEGKTILDYAPDSEIAQDFHHFAQWLRSVWKR